MSIIVNIEKPIVCPASEARRLYDKNLTIVYDTLRRIDNQIRRVAPVQQALELAGENCVYSTECAHASEPPHVMKMVIEELKLLGYTVTVEPTGYKYIPAGLRDDYDDNGPTWENYAINLKW